MFVLIPPLPPVHKRNVHQALRIPEILLIIFKHVTDDTTGKPLLPTLAAIARTCRLFQRPVEEVLWYKLCKISALYNILPSQVRSKESQTWSLSCRIFSGSEWTRFMDRASRIRVLKETTSAVSAYHERSWTIFLAIAALRDPPLLTPNLRKLRWQTNRCSFSPAINLFLSPSLQSLEIDAKLLINHVIRLPLGDICPRLVSLKITGNGRSAADTISSVLRGLYCLETVACSTLDNDAFVHLAQLKRLSYLAVDMRWSELRLDELRDRLHPGSFQSLQTLYWKDYNLELLAEIFLIPDVSPSNIHLEIESFCTSPSLRAFLHPFTTKFPNLWEFSLIHDIWANKRFGLQAGVPRREHHLDACDLNSIFALKSLRVLSLVDLGNFQLDDNLVKAIASAFPELEQLRLGTDPINREAIRPSVTFDGLLSLLQHCPRLQSVGLCFDIENMLSFADTAVRHEHVTHLRLEGDILCLRRTEVDEILRRVLPGLRTIEECLDGVSLRIRDVGATGSEGSTVSGPTAGRRTRNLLESGGRG